jgi:hypothetical protein
MAEVRDVQRAPERWFWPPRRMFLWWRSAQSAAPAIADPRK